MSTMQIAARLLGTAALVLAGCSGPVSNGNSVSGGSGAANATLAATDWDATNACALLDKELLGTALNDKVTETSIGLVHQASGAEAATSECTYMLASGSRATLMARNSPIADNTPEAMALARKATEQSVSAFTDKKVEDVPDLGKVAFFVPGINQLNVFIDERKFVILTIGSAPDASAKAIATDLARKIRN